MMGQFGFVPIQVSSNSGWPIQVYFNSGLYEQIQVSPNLGSSQFRFNPIQVCAILGFHWPIQFHPQYRLRLVQVCPDSGWD